MLCNLLIGKDAWRAVGIVKLAGRPLDGGILRSSLGMPGDSWWGRNESIVQLSVNIHCLAFPSSGRTGWPVRKAMSHKPPDPAPGISRQTRYPDFSNSGNRWHFVVEQLRSSQPVAPNGQTAGIARL